MSEDFLKCNAEDEEGWDYSACELAPPIILYFAGISIKQIPENNKRETKDRPLSPSVVNSAFVSKEGLRCLPYWQQTIR